MNGTTPIARAGRGDRMRPRIAPAAVAVLAAVSVLASACSSGSPGPVVSLPVPKTGEVTFYLSLPASTAGLSEAAAKVATPGSSNYRQFSSLAADVEAEEREALIDMDHPGLLR